MADKELIEKVRNTFYYMAWKDIEKTSGVAKFASFILCVCFIDALASLRYGVTKETSNTGSKVRFVKFLEEYFPKEYDANKLYSDFRCGVVHAYSSGETFITTDGNKKWHLKQLQDGRILLNLENFMTDTLKAYFQVEKQIETNENIYQLASNRIISLGLLGIETIKFQV